MDNKQLVDEEELDFGENAQFVRVYNFLPYSHWRIKEILKEHYNAHLQPIGGYKCNRVPNYKQEYNLIDNATGKVLAEGVILNQFRQLFARKNYPLHKKQSKHNSGAEKFLEVVKNLDNKGE